MDATWLVKTEPETYSFAELTRAGRGTWDGVRNVTARNHLRQMAEGELVMVYHTGELRQIVGVARVVRTAYPDPTSNRPIWSAVDLVPVASLERPVELAALRSEPLFAGSPLLRQPRLSVMPLSAEQFARVLALSETTLPARA